MTWWSAWAVVRQALAAALELVLPSSCAACHTVAAGPLCDRCRAGVRSASRDVGPAGPRPPPRGMPLCWAGARFEGALRLAVTAYKDEGRRDLRDDLARLLGTALSAATADPALRRRLTLGEEVLVVPVPAAGASRRRRGDDPVAALAHAATAAAGAPPRTPRAGRGAGARAHPPGVRPGAPRPAVTGPQPGRFDGRGRGLARGGAGSDLRGRRRRRHDRCHPRRGGPGPARRGGWTRRRGDVCDDTSPCTGPALVAPKPAD